MSSPIKMSIFHQEMMKHKELHPASETDGLLCKTCASEGHSCCQNREIYITHGDYLRIRSFLKAADIPFFEYRKCDNSDYGDQLDDPVWQENVFRSDGTRPVLRQKVNGECHFLSVQGCELPLDIRPLVCRLFPYTYTYKGLTKEWDESCPASHQRKKSEIVSGIAGLKRKEAMQWHSLLYEEIKWKGMIQ